MEDNEIIDLFFARTEQAIHALDGKYGRLCHGVALNILGIPADAEECVNDAYLGVWNAISPARPNPLVCFMCKIVRNLSLKCFRAIRAKSATAATMSRSANWRTASPRRIPAALDYGVGTLFFLRF